MLNALGHDVDDSARISPVLLVGVDRLSVGARSRVSIGNTLRNLRHARIGADALIGPWNNIWAGLGYRRKGAADPDTVGVFAMGDCAWVTRRHVLDCSGGLFLGPWSGLIGRGTLLSSHSLDLRTHAMACAPTYIGEGSFVAGRSTVTMGARLPDRSVLATCGVLVPGASESEAMYAGVPAKPVRHQIGDWAIFDYSEDGPTARTRRKPRPGGGSAAIG